MYFNTFMLSLFLSSPFLYLFLKKKCPVLVKTQPGE